MKSWGLTKPNLPEMGAPSSPGLGGSSPCRATETTSSVNLGDYGRAATWKPKFPSPGARFSSGREMETARFPELGGFPRATKQKPQSSAGLGGSPSLPRHGNPSSPHRGHGFCRGGTWKSPSFPELGGIRRAAKNGNPRAPRDPGGGFRRAVTWKLEVPHTWAAVSVTLRHGTPEYPVLGLRFPSRRDMGTPGFPDLGKFSAVPRNGNP